MSLLQLDDFYWLSILSSNYIALRLKLDTYITQNIKKPSRISDHYMLFYKEIKKDEIYKTRLSNQQFKFCNLCN